MARDLSPITKQSRREGYALHPKAHRIMMRRTAMPGQKANTRRPPKPSQYSIQLREKQKVRRLYGLLEKPFRNLMKESARQAGPTGENLLRMLELRLDNVVYRAGLANSRRASRQLVTHGHFMKNGVRVDIPSIQVKPGDEIVLRDKSKTNEYFKHLDELVDAATPVPDWLKVDRKKFAITVTGLPKREDAEPEINEQLIVEYYSR